MSSSKHGRSNGGAHNGASSNERDERSRGRSGKDGGEDRFRSESAANGGHSRSGRDKLSRDTRHDDRKTSADQKPMLSQDYISINQSDHRNDRSNGAGKIDHVDLKQDYITTKQPNFQRESVMASQPNPPKSCVDCNDKDERRRKHGTCHLRQKTNR